MTSHAHRPGRNRRRLQVGQVSELLVIDAFSGETHRVYETAELIEAPNWTPDGKWLIFNADGRLFRISPDGAVGPERIVTAPIENLNNDHVLSPDGQTIYLSNNDGHLYAVPIAGGEPHRISNDHATPFRYYLHGVSPDNRTLVYTGMDGEGDARRINLYTIPVAGGPDTQLSDIDEPNDGPEYSPDGRWIYFNSERAADRPGHAQIFRMGPDGSGIEQLTFDERVNWFPHFSPDGEWVVYLSYPEDTIGHPADKDVILRRMRPDGSESAGITVFFGGQGTINVNSWSPDNRHFACVAYPMD